MCRKCYVCGGVNGHYDVADEDGNDLACPGAATGYVYIVCCPDESTHDRKFRWRGSCLNEGVLEYINLPGVLVLPAPRPPLEELERGPNEQLNQIEHDANCVCDRECSS